MRRPLCFRVSAYTIQDGSQFMRWRAAYQYDDQPVDPSPASSLDQVTAGNRADAGAEERAEGPGRHGAAALLHGHHVGDAAAADGDGHGPGEAHEQAEGHQHADAVAEGGADGEDDEE